MSLDKKRQFVNVTYNILSKEGISEIKIRRLAQEMHCTSTVIYRYFDNLDHLIALASIRYLNDYLVDFSNLINDPLILTDPYTLNIKMWRCLAEHAYANMEIYEQIFFGNYSSHLAEVIFEYYQLFLDDTRNLMASLPASCLMKIWPSVIWSCCGVRPLWERSGARTLKYSARLKYISSTVFLCGICPGGMKKVSPGL